MRERRIVAMIGAQGTGKTTLGKAMLNAARARGARVRILDPEGNLGGTLPDDPEEWLEERLAETQNCMTMLVCDDFDRYVPKHLKANTPWYKIFLTNRHVMGRLGVDVILSGRRLQNLPENLKSAIDEAYLFQSSRMDRTGREAMQELAGDLELPAEPFRFLRIKPKTATGEPVYGWTLKRGGYVFDDDVE